MTIDKTKHCEDAFNINFNCEGTSICRFKITLNRIKIYQQFTFPIASRALETGIVDETKLTGQTAGSFGDGFKSAIVVLMADPKNGFDFIRWKFYAIKERTTVVWNFQGLTKDKIATFRRSQVLQIAIDKSVLSEDNIRHFTPKHRESGYVMKQSINAKDIGKSFREKVLPFFVVFWDLEEETLISLPTTGYDRLYFGRNHFIGPASQQPYLFD